MPPIRFTPIYKDYLWGGRTFESAFGRKLPEGVVAESWEIVDRPDAQSVVADGQYKGMTLRELIEKHGREILSENYDVKRPFPLLIKWLDAKERLSLQVHPPAKVAQELAGEPKTECWYIAKTTPTPYPLPEGGGNLCGACGPTPQPKNIQQSGAGVFAGLKNGTKWENLEKALLQNGVTPETGRKFENLVHRLPTKAGDFLFIPSGRLHAIDAGNLILEIQQNSNTTYRVYDWGRPRELHIEKSMKSIDFDDFEPELTHETQEKEQVLLTHPLFSVKRRTLTAGKDFFLEGQPAACILTVTEGQLSEKSSILSPGDTLLLPRGEALRIHAIKQTTLILTTNFL